MNIREARNEDIPEIVIVLKASLGEKELPLSEEIWKFKHVDNPFGKSLVLVAEEDEHIVGVRALMRWQWSNGNRDFSCLRAVDTATHPDHQGKGIFKKLTLRALEIAKEQGVDFVFNTPNEKSRPGYLKMGWQIVGNVHVGVKPAFKSFWKFKRRHLDYMINHQVSNEILENICNEFNKALVGNNLFTPKSVDYLKWRYENNPLRGYEVVVSPNYYLAGYVQVHKGLKELRVVECIYSGTAAKKDIKKAINHWCSKFGVQVITYSSQLLDLGPATVKGKFGPILTVRDLTIAKEEKDSIFSINNWMYSLGDLELF
jgi:N-acetylglutamate synthase-like GNAT family acetyltransferase